jgi:hypothetical protein
MTQEMGNSGIAGNLLTAAEDAEFEYWMARDRSLSQHQWNTYYDTQLATTCPRDVFYSPWEVDALLAEADRAWMAYLSLPSSVRHWGPSPMVPKRIPNPCHV